MYILSEAKRKISAVLKAEPTTTKKIAKLNFSNFFPCLYNVKVAEAKRNEINVGFFKVFFRHRLNASYSLYTFTSNGRCWKPYKH